MSRQQILLVDDEVDFSEALAKRLRARGLDVETAEDGLKAMALASAGDFTAIVLDLKMPGPDGLETLKHLLAANPDQQVILLTGNGSIREGVEAMKLGAVDFLEKPADFDSLFQKIQAAVDRRTLLAEKRAEEKLAKLLSKKGW